MDTSIHFWLSGFQVLTSSDRSSLVSAFDWDVTATAAAAGSRVTTVTPP